MELGLIKCPLESGIARHRPWMQVLCAGNFYQRSDVLKVWMRLALASFAGLIGWFNQALAEIKFFLEHDWDERR